MPSYNVSEYSSSYQNRHVNPSYITKLSSIIFNDMLIKSNSPNNKQITRLSFIEYFDAPLLLIERIYKVLFDNTSTISFQQFEEKLRKFMRMTLNEMTKFIFRLYDFDNNFTISGKDVNIFYLNILAYIKYNKNYDVNYLKFPNKNQLFSSLSSFSHDSFVEYIKNINSDMFIILFYFLDKIIKSFYDLLDCIRDDLSDIGNPVKNSESIDEEYQIQLGSINLYNIIENEKVIDNEQSPKSILKKNDQISLIFKTKNCLKKKIILDEPHKQMKLKFINTKKPAENTSRNNMKTLNFQSPEQLNNIFNYLNVNKAPLSTNSKTPMRSGNTKISLPIFNSFMSNPQNTVLHTQENKYPYIGINNCNTQTKFKLFSKFKLGAKNKSNLKLDSLSFASNINSSNQSTSTNQASSKHPLTTVENKKISFHISSSILHTKRSNSYNQEFLFFSFGIFTKYSYYIKNNIIFYYELSTNKLKGIISLHKISFKQNELNKYSLNPYYSITLFHNISSIQIYFENESNYKNFTEVLTSYCNKYNNAKINEKYKLSNVIGRGKYSVIYKCTNQIKSTGNIYAMKILRKFKLNKVDYEAMRREVQVMQLVVGHKNLGQYIESGENHEYVYIIMNYIPNKDLKTYIRSTKFSVEPEIIKSIAQDLLDLIKYFNQTGIIHRDIKAENIIFNPATHQITLIDFGLSRVIGDGEQIYNEPFGTLGYAAPEILLGEKYDSSIDLFSIGVLIYLLYFGVLPFEDDDDEIIYQNCLDCKVNYYGKEGKIISFLSSVLVKNSKKRSSINALLNHSWLKKELN